MTMQEPITTVEGPKGKADIFEYTITTSTGTFESEYEVKFEGGASEKFQSMGEAYVTAKVKVGLMREGAEI